MHVEVGHDPEVPAATAAAGPEEVGILVRAAMEVAAVGRDDPERGDVVARQAELPRAEPVAAAKRETGYPDGRARAARDRAAGRREPRLDVDQAGAGADRDDPRRRAQTDRAQPPEIDDEAGTRRVTRVAVATAANRELDLRLLRPEDDLGDVRGRERLYDTERIDGVEPLLIEDTRLLVRGGRRNENRALDELLERLQPSDRQRPRRHRRAASRQAQRPVRRPGAAAPGGRIPQLSGGSRSRYFTSRVSHRQDLRSGRRPHRPLPSRP